MNLFIDFQCDNCNKVCSGEDMLHKYNRHFCSEGCLQVVDDRINGFIKARHYYSRNPSKFAEDFLGVKLKLYQKIILKLLK